MMANELVMYYDLLKQLQACFDTVKLEVWVGQLHNTLCKETKHSLAIFLDKRIHFDLITFAELNSVHDCYNCFLNQKG